MRLNRLYAVVVAAASLATLAQAQHAAEASIPPDVITEGPALTPRGSFHLSGYSGSRNFVGYRVHLFQRRITSEMEVGVFVPWAMRISANPGIARQWADGTDCPAIYGVVQAIADFPSPRFRDPMFQQLPRGSNALPAPPQPLEAPKVSVFGLASFADGSSGNLIVSGTSGRIVDLVNFAETELHGCWSDNLPDAVDGRD